MIEVVKGDTVALVEGVLESGAVWWMVCLSLVQSGRNKSVTDEVISSVLVSLYLLST